MKWLRVNLKNVIMGVIVAYFVLATINYLTDGAWDGLMEGINAFFILIWGLLVKLGYIIYDFSSWIIDNIPGWAEWGLEFIIDLIKETDESIDRLQDLQEQKGEW